MLSHRVALNVVAVSLLLLIGVGAVVAISRGPNAEVGAPVTTGAVVQSHALQGGDVLTMPVEVDLREQGRVEAEAFLSNDPDELDGVVAVPTLTAYLSSADPVVRGYGANAVQRIAMSPTASESGLREAVLQDAGLQSALLGTLDYVTVSHDDVRMWSSVLYAVLELYRDEPSAAIEQLVTDYYAQAFDLEVRKALVAVACEHHYASGATVAMLEDAAQGGDELEERAEACLAMLP